ncbi:hypothetical protein LOCUS_46110 [Klebsiella pneumoniae]|nr:hypothetical protein LOCUS_44360 [Klebsiella pneumoniae]GMW33748.1 hypothetical protein LOCUS_46110 [Klebsiella pneumoniae]
MSIIGPEVDRRFMTRIVDIWLSEEFSLRLIDAANVRSNPLSFMFIGTGNENLKELNNPFGGDT